MNSFDVIAKMWWGSQDNVTQLQIKNFYFPNRDLDSLTPTEIHIIWKNEVGKVNQKQVMITLDEAIEFSNWCDKNYTYKKGYYVHKMDQGRKKLSVNKKDLYRTYKKIQDEKNANLNDGNAIDGSQLSN
jgi:hypothetical protein